MDYEHSFVASADIPTASMPLFQHLLDTYASETNKTAAVWSELRDDQLGFRPHGKSSSVREILAHHILSERRFFAEFLFRTTRIVVEYPDPRSCREQAFYQRGSDETGATRNETTLTGKPGLFC